VEAMGCNDYLLLGDLTIRGVTRRVPLKITYLGQWQTP
jgi:polyisoprenoid-binding protein YceI